MTPAVLLAAALALAATPLSAQMAGRTVAVDFGLGVESGPSYPGSDEGELSPWLILRDGAASGAQGLSFGPSFGLKGKRDAEGALTGFEPIARAFEFGGRVAYGLGPVNVYATLRRGFGGHEGVTGAIGTRYRSDISPDLTLWSGVEAVYGDASFHNTYFGVTEAEHRASGLPASTMGGGFNTAALTFEARYALTASTALLGQVRYARLIDDAADAPVVQDKYQPSVRVGVTRSFAFGF